MTQTEREKEMAWALKMADLEESLGKDCVISAGFKTISDMVEIMRLQEEAVKKESATKQKTVNASRASAVKPVPAK
jgi:tetrahydrodipicolinate N-succinyltransferase